MVNDDLLGSEGRNRSELIDKLRKTTPQSVKARAWAIRYASALRNPFCEVSSKMTSPIPTGAIAARDSGMNLINSCGIAGLLSQTPDDSAAAGGEK